MYCMCFHLILYMGEWMKSIFLTDLHFICNHSFSAGLYKHSQNLRFPKTQVRHGSYFDRCDKDVLVQDVMIIKCSNNLLPSFLIYTNK